MPLKLLFITGNANKLAEVQAILAGKVHLQSQELDLPELQGSIQEVSTDKCRRAAEIVRSHKTILTQSIIPTRHPVI